MNKFLSIVCAAFCTISSFAQSVLPSSDIVEEPANRIANVIHSCEFQRNDFLLIGDSNTLFGGTGWDHGYQYALNLSYPMYASGLVFLGENRGAGAGVGYGYSVLSNASSHQFNYPGSILWNPNQAIELATSFTLTGVGLTIADNSPLFQNNGLRFHYEIQTFNTSGGSYRCGVQSGVSPYSAIIRFIRFSTYSATPALNQFYNDFPAGNGTGPIQFKLGIDGLYAPFAATWVRAERPNIPNGFSLSTWYGFGGQSGRDMAAAFAESSIADLGKYLQDVTKLQTSESYTIVRINTGLNDRNETVTSITSNFPGDSAAAYSENIQYVCNRISTAWASIGKNPEKLYFIVAMSQAISVPNDPKLVAFENILPVIAANVPNCFVIPISSLATYEEMTNWYNSVSDHLHMKTAGYETLAQRELATIH